MKTTQNTPAANATISLATAPNVKGRVLTYLRTTAFEVVFPNCFETYQGTSWAVEVTFDEVKVRTPHLPAAEVKACHAALLGFLASQGLEPLECEWQVSYKASGLECPL